MDQLRFNIQMDFRELRVLASRLRKFERDDIPAASKAFIDSTTKDVKDSIRNGPKTGKKWRGTKTPNRSSAPGEPPANQTGTLLRSIRGRFKNLGSQVDASVSVAAAHGKWLEEGRERRGRGILLPRPFLKPALEKNLPAFEHDLQSRLNKQVGKSP